MIHSLSALNMLTFFICVPFFLCPCVGLPWWVAIVVSTFTIKLLLIPLVVKSRISSVRLQNNMPEMMKLQLKMSEARTNRDHVAAKKCVFISNTSCRIF